MDNALIMDMKSIKPSLAQIEKWMSLSNISGSLGTNRERKDRLQINAENDYQAIQCWLAEYQHKPTTLRTYQKEAERFLLWCIIQKQKPLSSINRDNVEQYAEFLANPTPYELWCGKKGGRKQKRGFSEWKPFAGPLSSSTRMTALSILDSLFSYLTDARYLAFNPFSLIRKIKFKKAHVHTSAFNIHNRILEVDEWRALLHALENFPEITQLHRHEKERLKFLVAILFFLGLRINELATHTWNAFRKVDERWWFFVIGKGDKLAKIPVNDEFLRIIIRYRSYLKLAPYPTTHEAFPLISSIKDRNSAISPRHMNKLLKKLGLETAKQFTLQPEKEQKLKKFSAHWLRHLSASMQDRAGVSFKHIRSNLRHENDDTTRLYVHALDEERHKDMQKLSLF